VPVAAGEFLVFFVVEDIKLVAVLIVVVLLECLLLEDLELVVSIIDKGCFAEELLAITATSSVAAVDAADRLFLCYSFFARIA